MKSIRDWLKEIRMSRNLTQEQVANLSKISRTMLTEIENGNANPSVETAKKIANALNFDWTLFYKEETA